MKTILCKFDDMNLVSVNQGSWREPKRAGRSYEVHDSLEEMGYTMVDQTAEKNIMIRTYKKPETDLEKLKIALVDYDWTWFYSDDYRVTSYWSKYEEEIKRLIKKIGKEGEEIYAKCAEDHKLAKTLV